MFRRQGGNAVDGKTLDNSKRKKSNMGNGRLGVRGKRPPTFPSALELLLAIGNVERNPDSKHDHPKLTQWAREIFKLRFSTTHHPQTNRQFDVMIRVAWRMRAHIIVSPRIACAILWRNNVETSNTRRGMRFYQRPGILTWQDWCQYQWNYDDDTAVCLRFSRRFLR